MSKQTIYLDTLFRNGSSTTQQPTWSLPSTLISNTHDDETLRLTIVDVLIPFNSYNIFSYPTPLYPTRQVTENSLFTTSDMTFDFTAGSGPAALVAQPIDTIIPMGNYNVFDLCAYLAAAQTARFQTLENPGGAFSYMDNIEFHASYNFNTMSYEFDWTIPVADGTITGSTGPGVPGVAILWNSTDQFQTTGLGWEVFGGVPNPATPTVQYWILSGSPTAFVPTQKANFNAVRQGNVGCPKTIGIQLDLVSKNVGHDGNGIGYTTTTATLPMNVPNGCIITYQNINNDFVVDIPSHYLDQLRVTLTQEKGRAFYPNEDWKISFRIDYLKVDHSNEKLLSEMIYLSQLQIMGQKEIIESGESNPNSIQDNLAK